MKPAKAIEPPHTSPFQPPLCPACSCLCCKNPEKSGAGLSGERAGAKSSRVDFAAAAGSEHHAQDLSSPGCRGVLDGVGWAPGWGREHEKRGGKEPLWSGRNCQGECISIPYQLLPATNQPSHGALVSVTREHRKSAGSERGRTAPCL